MNAMDQSFTPMEIQISHLVRAGRTNKEIARILTIAPRTVGFHRENIRRKLGINNKKVNLRSVLLSCG
jgi:DNA-binding CsgD family transcriptional regulator